MYHNVMTQSNEIRNDRNNVPSHNSTITDGTINSRDTDEQLTTEQKKRKYEQVQSSRRWIEEDQYEVQGVKQIVRNNIFKHVKFVKGEGYKNITSNAERKMEKVV